MKIEVKGLETVMVIADSLKWQGLLDKNKILLMELFFKRITSLTFVKHFAIWTINEDIAGIAEQFEIHHIRPETDQILNQAPALTTISEKKRLGDGLNYFFGTVGVLQFFYDLSYLLVRESTLENMYDQLLENEYSHEIVAAYKVDPHLYQFKAEKLIQLWDCPGLDRQRFPEIYRQCRISIRHALRQSSFRKNSQLFDMAWTEGFRYSEEYEEFFLQTLQQAINKRVVI